jgi:3-hydroxybutyrate dehydrogenase
MASSNQRKSALVTGSTSGLGKGIAQALAAAGCDVVLNGFGDPGEIEKLRAGLAADFGVEVYYQAADLTRPEDIASLISRTLARFSGLDVLVNNAGTQFVAPLEKFPADKWDQLIALNLSAAFHTTKAVLPAMRERRWGRIVNIASAHGLVASPFKSAYVAAKHGLVGLTKVTALETGGSGITCNAVCPGYVLTELVDKQIDEQARAAGVARERVIEEKFLSKHPSGEFVPVEQVAAMVTYLCSDAASAVTGAALSVDGGWTAI